MNTAMLLRPKAMITYLYGDTSAADGLVQMIESGFTAVPVINRDGYYLGVVSERDFLFCILDDGSVDARDLSMLKRCVITGDEPENFEAADLNGDGSIDEDDAALHAEFLTGKIKAFPAN